MANNIARSFLNDTSVILLESSEGARNVVKKQQELRGFEQKGIDKRVELEVLFKKSSDNNKAICDLRGIGFFGRLFKKKEIEAELAKLEGIKRELDNDISATIDKIDLIEKIVSRLKTELAKYAEELAKVGLTPEDIVAEYNLIKQELAIKAQTKPASVQEEKKAESKPAKITTGTKQSTRMSPLDKFNSRMRKYQEYQEAQAKKSEPTEQEKQ